MNEKIALGFGNNIDYEIVWDSQVFEDLIAQYDLHAEDLDIDIKINSERDLVTSILAFLKGGQGGERFVASSAIVENFSQRFESKVSLGGTSVRAAVAMRKFGYTSTLHLVTINDHVRRLIPHDSPWVCSNTTESSYPHLIVQFGKNTRIRANDIDICSCQANRLIYHSDDDNIRMSLNEEFAHLIGSAQILLVSGFNAMHSEALLTNRLEAVLKFISGLPEGAQVFYEEAGFYDPKFRQIIYRALAGQIDIVSLNEDEMQGHLHKKVDLLDISQIEAALAELQHLIPVPVIVVHTKCWALAYGTNAARFARALKAGVTMATTRFRYGDDFTIENYREIENLAASDENAAFVEALNKLPGHNFYGVPVAHVDQSNGTTVGLGDTFVAGFLPATLAE